MGLLLISISWYQWQNLWSRHPTLCDERRRKTPKQISRKFDIDKINWNNTNGYPQVLKIVGVPSKNNELSHPNKENWIAAELRKGPAFVCFQLRDASHAVVKNQFDIQWLQKWAKLQNYTTTYLKIWSLEFRKQHIVVVWFELQEKQNISLGMNQNWK